MKTLFISDLDGTLLNKNAELSEYTVGTLNSLIADGLNFSVATARTAASVTRIMSQINLNHPIILMNGVLIYDLRAGRYLKIEPLAVDAVAELVEMLAEFRINGFMYAIGDNQLQTCYTELDNQPLVDFYQERRRKYDKSFEQIGSFSCMKDRNTIYCSLMPTREKLEPIREHLSGNSAIGQAFYKDIYSDDWWYLELFSSKASKEHAVNYMREECGFDRIVGFGDNTNDIPLFRACDEKYAVANAREDIRRLADQVIGSNESDGVARFLLDFQQTRNHKN